MNINCFLKEFKQDQEYKKDIAAAAIVSGIIIGILAKGEKPQEKLKYDIERKTVEVKDPALRKELNMSDNASEVTLSIFLDILTAMKESGKELMCKYCGITKVREITVQNPDGTTTITIETYDETEFQLFSEKKFQGRIWTFDITKESFNDLNIILKSFKIPPGVLVKMYFETNFQGDPVVFSGIHSDISSFRGMDLPIKSIEILKYQASV